MFTQQLPASVFETQREFIKVMNANKDFVWWADSLIKEETKELKEVYEAETQDMEHIFKELGDLIYVIAGFYNVLPTSAPFIVDDETNQRLQTIMDEAAIVVSEVCQKLQIPLPIVVLAFELVHESNMSKVNPETGKPDRREDGKILKGPNYQPPSMARAVEAWSQFTKAVMEQNQNGTEAGH